ncbi:TetR/AcrR family transcriptional regulator [Streptomyces sp. NBC_00457]|uniref:TetR/AcrR family transcriptional regulator n=1 Tax=Streptomyces sp. NBC_00457 TaxID=2975748 RepID=UPI002E1D8077
MSAGEASEHAERSRHSRLTADRERDIYEAVLTLLREVDYDALAMDDVAARARASKATFYRRWQGKPRLVAAALRHRTPVESDALDTGSLAGDLHEIARRAGGAAHQEDVVLLRALSRAAHAHPELADAMYDSRIRPKLQTMRAVVDRAIDRGEVAANNPALGFLPHLIAGANLARPVVERAEADAAYLSRYVDAVVLPALLSADTP